MLRVEVKPEMLRWARERAGLDELDLTKRFPKLIEWESQESLPTFKQLENYAKVTRTPIGYLFLPEPPEEKMPIPDFRTMANRAVTRPSPDLLDMIYLCQQRQAWYQEHARNNGFAPVAFVGSVSRQTPIEKVACVMRDTLNFDLEARRQSSTWQDALRDFIAQADNAGVMVMCSGVVLNNNRRKLDPQEFRGFALADDLAPLIFINGADSKAAQMFTLAHELAHLWLGQSALSSVEIAGKEEQAIEQWCNTVAAELLVPMNILKEEFDANESIEYVTSQLARRFKVSTLVIVRRLWDADFLSRDQFFRYFAQELTRIASLQQAAGGGNFYLSQAARVSKRFTRALIESTLEGQTLYRDAMKMLGVSKISTFNELGRSLNVMM